MNACGSPPTLRPCNMHQALNTPESCRNMQHAPTTVRHHKVSHVCACFPHFGRCSTMLAGNGQIPPRSLSLKPNVVQRRPECRSKSFKVVRNVVQRRPKPFRVVQGRSNTFVLPPAAISSQNHPNSSERVQNAAETCNIVRNRVGTTIWLCLALCGNRGRRTANIPIHMRLC